MKKKKVVRKSSHEWLKLYPIRILDPDGWDRSNYWVSMNEKITLEEFNSRVNRSTTMDLKIQAVGKSIPARKGDD